MQFHSHRHFQTAVGTSNNLDKRKWWQVQSQSDECQTKQRGNDDRPKKTKKTKRTFVDALRAKAKLFSGADIDDKDDWTHLRHCKKTKCQTCTFLAMVVKWKPLVMYMDQQGKSKSWLGRKQSKKGHLMAGCKVCRLALEANPNWTCPWSSFSMPVEKL